MITFRFYLVTLVAIFLAVALGVVIGSTFLEPALVQDLNNQVASVRENLDERVARIDDLNDQIGALDEYVEGSAPFAVDGSLDGAVVVVAADEGVEAGPVERLVSRLRQAGATTEGIVWMQPGMGSGEDALAVIDALELDVDADDPEAVRAAAWTEVVERIGDSVAPDGGDDPGTTTTTASTGSGDTTTSTGLDGTTTVPPTSDTTGTDTAPTTDATTTTSVTTPSSLPVPALFEADPLRLLEDSGWIRLQEIEVADPVPSRPAPVGPPPLAVVLVTGPEAEPETPSVVELARHQAAAGVATVVAEVWVEPDGESTAQRGEALRPLRDDAELSARVSTVDDLDLIQGQVATALAIRDLGSGIAGHYGYGPSAELVLPPWLGP
jgi:hypothetical protein